MKKNPNGCVAPKYNFYDLEQKVLSELEKLRDDPNLAKTYVNESSDINVDSLNDRLQVLNNQLKKLVALFIDDDFPKDVIESKKTVIVNEKKAIIRKIDEAEKNKPDTTLEDVNNELSKIDVSMFDLEYEDQKRIVRKLIKRIVLYPETMEIHWAFAI